MNDPKKLKPLHMDMARCIGEDCFVRETCRRYLTIDLDTEKGRYTYSFFNAKNCNSKIEVSDEQL